MHRIRVQVLAGRAKAGPDRAVAKLFKRAAGMPGLNHRRFRPHRKTAQKVGNLVDKDKLRPRQLRNRFQAVLHDDAPVFHPLPDTDNRHGPLRIPFTGKALNRHIAGLVLFFFSGEFSVLVSVLQRSPDHPEIVRQSLLPDLQKYHAPRYDIRLACSAVPCRIELPEGQVFIGIAHKRPERRFFFTHNSFPLSSLSPL